MGRYSTAAVVVLAVVALGVLVVRGSHAFTDVFNSEAETGTLIGDVATSNDGTASGGQAITFGAGSVPTNLQAFTGGNNIALVWDMPANPVQSVQVFRNGTQIGTVSPNSSAANQNAQIGKEYDDNSVSAGSTYQYKVRAVLASGATSAFSATANATQPTSSQPVPNITIDTSAAPNLASYMSTNIVPLLKTWYPKVADYIAFPNYTAPTSYTIRFSSGPTNGCNTSISGSTGIISCDPNWVTNTIPSQLNDLAAVFVHESTHVIQDAAVGPSWTVEGGASWASDYYARQNINTYRPYTGDTLGPYTPGAWFIEYMRENYNQNFPRDINVAIHNNVYPGSIFPQDTGGALTTPEQAWQTTVNAFNSGIGTFTAGGKCLEDQNGTIASGTKIILNGCSTTSSTLQANVAFYSGISGKCLDDYLGSTTTNPDLYDCNQSDSQLWTVNSNGTVETKSGACLDNWQGANTNGNPVKFFACSATDPAQQWVVSGNIIKNPATGKCLDDPNSATGNFTALDLWTCNGTNSQVWKPTGGLSISGNPAQKWVRTYHQDSKSGAFEVTSPIGNLTGVHYCLDVSASGTADGTNVQYWACNQTNAEMWTTGSNSSIVNVNSGKCLDTADGSTASGTQIVINTCNGSATQKWAAP